MISLIDISLSYGKKNLFNSISCVIGARDRIALIGSNGSGKSTLLKLLLGEIEPDSGTIEKPSHVSIGYLPQDGLVARGKSLYAEVETAFEDTLSLQKKLDDAGELMATMDTSSEEFYELIDAMGDWEEQLSEHEPHKMRSQIEKVLQGLGFSRDDSTLR